jgi:hypothetical protein
MPDLFHKLILLTAVMFTVSVTEIPQAQAAIPVSLDLSQTSTASPITGEQPPSPTPTTFASLADRVMAEFPTTSINAAADCIKPATPILYNPTNNSTVTDSRPYFDWSAVADATDYHIAIQDSHDAYNYIFVQTDVSNYTPDVDLVDSDYEWLVLATNNSPGCSVNSDLSETWNFVLDANPTCEKPGTPQLIAPANNSTVITSWPQFDWSDVTDATEYWLWVLDLNDPNPPSGDKLQIVTQSEAMLSEPLDESTYQWYVYGHNTAGGCDVFSDSSVYWYVTIDTTPTCNKPGIPQLISPPNDSVLSNKRPQFDWSDVADATEYHIAVQDDHDAYNWLFEKTTASEFTPSTDLIDSDYQWLVFASNTSTGCNVNGDSTGTWAFTINAVPPLPPTLVSPTNGSTTSDNTPTFSWLSSVGAEQYHLEVDNNSSFASPEVNTAPSNTSFTLTSSLADGTYYWRVRSADHYGSWSNWSTVWSVTVNTLSPPPAPTLNEVLNDWAINYEVSWSTVSAATSYELQENHDSSGWNTIFSGTDTRFTRYDRPDGQWCYRVRGVNAAGPGNWSNTQCATVDTTPPPVPNLISPTDGATLTDNTPTFSWSSVTGATGYIWMLDDDSSMQSTVDSAIVYGTSYTPSPIPDGTYYWAVESFDAADNHSTLSSPRSLTINTASVPPTPTLHPISNPEWDGTYTVSWSSVSSATSYELQERFNSGSWSTTSLTGTSKNYSGKADGQWCYQVRGVNNAGPGGWSSLVCTIVDTTPPQPPTLISPSNPSIIDDSTPTFDWNDPATATGYRLQVDDLSNFSSPQVNVTPSTSSFTVGSPLLDGDYFWRVQAQDWAGNWSNWSAIWSLTVKTTSPVVVDMGFRPNPDGYSFYNYGGVDYNDFTIDDERQMLGDDLVCTMVNGVCQPLQAALDWNRDVNQAMGGGHCTGFTVSSLRFFAGYDDPSDYQVGAKVPYDISFDNGRRHVSYYWVHQLVPPVTTFETDTWDKSPSQILPEIETALSPTSPDPVDLTIYNWDLWVGHSVAPYAVEDKGDGVYWVKIYDNNAPNDNSRYIVINTVTNTWSYPAYGWHGTATSRSLGIKHISIYDAPAGCPWCNTTALQASSTSTALVWLYTQDRVLVTDSQGRRLGFVDDSFVNEIPNAQGHFPVGGLGIPIHPIYSLPQNGDYTISLSAAAETKASDSSTVPTKISQYGPGYAVTVTDIDAAGSSDNTINITPDGTSVTVHAGNAVEPTVKIDASTPGDDQAFQVSGADIGTGQAMAMSVDVSSQKLVVDNSKTSGGSYDLHITKQDATGSHTFNHTNIAVSAADTQVIDYSQVDTSDTVTVSVDHGSDGTIDDTVTLENQTIKVYLPLVIRK